MTDDVYAETGLTVPVIYDDEGFMLCPGHFHDHRMVEVDPGYWRCPWALEAEREIVKLLGPAIERLIADMEHK